MLFVGRRRTNDMSHVDGVDDGYGYGVRGASSRGDGVRGCSDRGYGVLGRSNIGPGVVALSSGRFGVLSHSYGGGYGVYGNSNYGYGVYGKSYYGYGVYGDSDEGHGVLGLSGSSSYAGVYGKSNFGYGVYGDSHFGYGVYGISHSGYGVYGISASSNGVYGSSIYFNGVRGYSASGNGVYGDSHHGYGVYGYSDTGIGIYGRSRSGHSGVYGSSETGYGLYGRSDSGLAAYLDGNVRITGRLQKAGGSFKIDHPLDPANKYLSHSFVESPDMKNVYDGVAVLDEKGEAEIDLPDWFGALNKDFRYQLTAIGAPGPNLHIAEEISDADTTTNYSSNNNNNNSRFKIAGGASGMKVSWQGTGIRKDPWANAHRIEVEEDKPDKERGYYLHPDLYRQPEEKGISHLLFPKDKREEVLARAFHK